MHKKKHEKRQAKTFYLSSVQMYLRGTTKLQSSRYAFHLRTSFERIYDSLIKIMLDNSTTLHEKTFSQTWDYSQRLVLTVKGNPGQFETTNDEKRDKIS